MFDLFAPAGTNLRYRPLRDRRAALERLAAGWALPLELCLGTSNPTIARA